MLTKPQEVVSGWGADGPKGQCVCRDAHRGQVRNNQCVCNSRFWYILESFSSKEALLDLRYCMVLDS